ncbi:hypothetical protein [Thiorhodococcus minor]|uniref:hypothetical protein n=1 Tax=Thiorhodococcus minor TaxID=57489 RepID=UPI003CC90E42
MGGAQVSEIHANFINNVGGRATARDVLSLVRLIRERVKQETGHHLYAEVRYVAPDGKMYPAHAVPGLN